MPDPRNPTPAPRSAALTGGWAAHPRALWQIMAADGLARLGYQVGKTPLLPIYAAMLGASDLIIGYVVAISTLTGLALKPLVGVLSDRTGRRLWLLTGLVLFAGVPFLYRFVETPQDLYALRLLHGTATAVFGPVSLAFVAEMGARGRAERLGIFGMTRQASYLAGPLIGAALLTVLPPAQVFTLIGLLSLVALLPGLALRDAPAPRQRRPAPLRQTIKSIRASRSFWLVAVLEILVTMATYAVKAFLPVFALRAIGLDLILIGAFFTLQEAVHMALRPLGGRLADRYGPDRLIGSGLLVLALALAGLGALPGTAGLTLAAIGIGAGLGLVLPATLSLLATEVRPDALGAGMGALGALRNLAKVLGPVLAGVLLGWVSYETLFLLTGAGIAATALVFGLWVRRASGTGGQERHRAETGIIGPRITAEEGPEIRKA